MVGGVVNPNMAANAYANSQKIMPVSDPSAGVNAAPRQNGDVSFADLIKNSVTESVNTMQGGEDMSAQAITGKADLTDVVQAVTAAELTLQSVVAIRDRMISAYQDIMRMPI